MVRLEEEMAQRDGGCRGDVPLSFEEVPAAEFRGPAIKVFPRREFLELSCSRCLVEKFSGGLKTRRSTDRSFSEHVQRIQLLYGTDVCR